MLFFLRSRNLRSVAVLAQSATNDQKWCIHTIKNGVFTVHVEGTEETARFQESWKLTVTMMAFGSGATRARFPEFANVCDQKVIIYRRCQTTTKPTIVTTQRVRPQNAT
jgi:hypothetical protein